MYRIFYPINQGINQHIYITSMQSKYSKLYFPNSTDHALDNDLTIKSNIIMNYSNNLSNILRVFLAY